MTKQQLREAIRRVIKQELLNEALGFLPPMQVAYFDGYDDAKNNREADVNYYRNHMELNEAKTFPKAGENGNVKVSQLKKGDILAATGDEIVSVSAGAKTPSDKLEVTTKNSKGNTSTKEWGKNTVVKLKDKTNEAAPAPSKPATAPGTKEPPSKTPDKKEPRRPLGNPNTGPIPAKAKGKKATMKEAEMLKQVIKRFKSKKNA